MKPFRSSPDTKRGNATYVALVLLVLFGFAALVVDVGHLRAARAELQAATDASALAGVAALDGTPKGCATVPEVAAAIGVRNRVFGRPVVVEAADIAYGVFDDGAVTELGPTCTDRSNTVQITTAHDEVAMAFSPVAFGGPDRRAVGARAIAIRPGKSPAGAVDCYLPVAVPACAVSGRAEFVFRRSGSGEDTAGWATPTSAPASAAHFKAQLAGYACDPMRVGEDANVNNGEVGAAEAVIEARLNHRASASGQALAPPDPWPAALGGPPSGPLPGSRVASRYFGTGGITGAVMMVTAGDADLDGVDDLCDTSPPNFNGTMRVVGFAYGIVYDVSRSDVAVMVDTTYDWDAHATGGGGTADHGLVFEKPARLLE